MELALGVGMGALAYAWGAAAHRKSTASPYLAALFFLFTVFLVWKFWQAI